MKDNIGKKNVIVVLIIVSLLLVCIGTWFFKMNYYDGIKNEEEINNMAKEIEWSIVRSIIYEDYLSAKNQSYIIAEHITTEILEDYPDLDILKSEFDNIKDDSYNMEFLNDIRKNIKNKYLHGIENERNNIFVCMESGIITGKVDNNNINNYPYSWDNYINKSMNKSLTKNAIENLLDRKGNIIYWELNYTGDQLDIPEIGKQPDIENIHELYKKYGLNGLRFVQLLAPAYITEDGDIFGNETFDLYGNRTKYEIIVVQTFNPYDQIYSRHNTELYKLKSVKEKLISYYNFNMLQYSSTMMIVIILTIIIIYFLITKINNYRK